MKRRKFIQNSIGFGIAMSPLVSAFSKTIIRGNSGEWKISGPKEPLFIYNNWSAYDELSDHVAQTETLAMNELNQIIRLKKLGVRFDYYVMDAFWFSKEGGYRSWLKEHWPNGPDKWLQTCITHHIKPGMWFSTNLVKMGGRQVLDIIPEWQDSLATDPNILCLFDGGYLKHLGDTLQLWYDKGVRLFKFDFAYFEAVTPLMKDKFTKEEIIEKNKVAFMQLLQSFRNTNPDVLITGYNGFGGEMENTVTPFKKTIDHRWLDVFDTLYSGDPRFSDVPMMNIWRSADNYSDHMNRQYEFNGLPMYRIDSCAFMIGKTGTCYSRALQSWKGMAILEFARGGWVNVVHGNLELWNDSDGEWLAKLQNMYMPLQKINQVSSFGEIPGKALPYGFKSKGNNGEVFTVVNPSQANSKIKLPTNFRSAIILYSDAGFIPKIHHDKNSLYLELGAEQLAVVGTGIYENKKFSLGRDETIIIPQSINKIEAGFKEIDKNKISAEPMISKGKNLRIVFQQFDSNGYAYRTWGGAPPDGKKMDELLKIEISQNGKPVKTNLNYDKMIWSGLSWAVVEVDAKDLDFSQPIKVQCSSMENDKLSLSAGVYEVEYES